MNFLEPQDWSFPVPIIYGPGRLSEIADLSTRAGMTKPLIVTDRGSAGLPFIADLKGYLSKVAWILRFIQISRLIREMMNHGRKLSTEWWS